VVLKANFQLDVSNRDVQPCFEVEVLSAAIPLKTTMRFIKLLRRTAGIPKTVDYESLERKPYERGARRMR
jgi:hypothetical protein